MAPDHRCRGRGAPHPRRAQRVRPGPVCRPRPCAAAAAGRPQPENKPSRRTLITDDNGAGTLAASCTDPRRPLRLRRGGHAARHAAAAGRGALARGAGRTRTCTGPLCSDARHATLRSAYAPRLFTFPCLSRTARSTFVARGKS